MSFSSEIQQEIAARDVPLTIIWNDRRLVCFCERPLTARESVIRVEANLPGVLRTNRAPRADEL
jgi:hypothetical protein